jgi:hypothetical protein
VTKHVGKVAERSGSDASSLSGESGEMSASRTWKNEDNKASLVDE